VVPPIQALETGVYNKVVGDGREFVVASPTAVKLRAEDGRSVAGVDISGFINNLPQGRPTNHFYTADASGSTSQAASLLEALEVGCDTFLIDEVGKPAWAASTEALGCLTFMPWMQDTSASNFLTRDARMALLVEKAKEPITPFVQRVVELHTRFNVSSILVRAVMACAWGTNSITDHGVDLDCGRSLVVLETTLPVSRCHGAYAS